MTRTAAPAEVRKLSDLLEVSQTLGSTLNLKTALHRVLEILEQSHGTVSGSVILARRDTGDLVVEAATGASAQAARHVRYRVGEGITGRVVQSGRPVVVPRVSREPLFLNRTGVFPRPSGKERSSPSSACPIKVDTAPWAPWASPSPTTRTATTTRRRSSSASWAR